MGIINIGILKCFIYVHWCVILFLNLISHLSIALRQLNFFASFVTFINFRFINRRYQGGCGVAVPTKNTYSPAKTCKISTCQPKIASNRKKCLASTSPAPSSNFSLLQSCVLSKTREKGRTVQCNLIYTYLLLKFNFNFQFIQEV